MRWGMLDMLYWGVCADVPRRPSTAWRRLNLISKTYKLFSVAGLKAGGFFFFFKQTQKCEPESLELVKNIEGMPACNMAAANPLTGASEMPRADQQCYTA